MAELNVNEIRVELGDPEAHGLTLLTILLYTFGPAVFGDEAAGVDRMDPSEMWAGLNAAYGTWLTEEGENRVNALMTAMDSPLFYRDPAVFEAVTVALCDGDLGDILHGEFEDVTALEMLWAILEVELANDAEEGPPEFSPQVMDYIDSQLSDESENLDDAKAGVEAEFRELIRDLERIGVSRAALRHYHAEFVEVMEAEEQMIAEVDEISTSVVS